MSLNVNFFDRDTQACPFDLYKALHNEAPVYQDPMTGIFHVSRFEDVRHILANHDLFSGNASQGDRIRLYAGLGNAANSPTCLAGDGCVSGTRHGTR